jgi:hypothetical protein
MVVDWERGGGVEKGEEGRGGEEREEKCFPHKKWSQSSINKIIPTTKLCNSRKFLGQDVYNT